MYEARVKYDFSSAHFLRNYKGKCENLHGHNYVVKLTVKSAKLNNEQMVIDFKELKTIIKEAVSPLDHKLINDIDFFKENQATAENIAKFIYDAVKQKIKDKKIKVRVYENADTSAVYYD